MQSYESVFRRRSIRVVTLYRAFHGDLPTQCDLILLTAHTLKFVFHVKFTILKTQLHLIHIFHQNNII